MQLPTSAYSLAVLVLLVIPGITFATVQSLLTGPTTKDKTVGVRILEAVLVSVIFDCIYAIAFSSIFPLAVFREPDFALKNLSLLGFLILAMLVALPAVVAVLCFGSIELVTFDSGRLKGWRLPWLVNGYERTPTAWDKVAQRIPSGRFVRVRLESGSYVGGWFSTGSFLSTFPEPRDMFIESQYNMNEDGEFGEKIPGNLGVWVAVTDKCVVEWIGDHTDEEGNSQ